MKKSVIRKEILPGIFITDIKDSKFKTTSVSVNIVMPMEESTASLYSLLPFVLKRGSSEYPDFTALNRHLEELYGAVLYQEVEKVGDAQVLNLAIKSVNNIFALGGEDITASSAELLCSLITDPPFKNGLFRERDVNQEIRCLIESIESELADKRIYASNRCEAEMFKGRPYGIHRFGSIERAREITPKKLTEAWRDCLKKVRIEIITVGQTDYDKDIFVNAFCNIDREPITIENKPEQLEREPRFVEEKLQVSQGKLCIGMSTGMSENLDQVDAMVLFNVLYGGSPKSKLFEKVREELSLCYYCSSQYNKHKEFIMVNSGIEFKDRQKAEEEILNQLELIKRGEFTESELEAAKLSLANRLRTIENSQGGIEQYYLDQILYNSRLRDNNEYADSIMSIKPEEIVKAANRVKPDTFYFLSSTEIK